MDRIPIDIRHLQTLIALRDSGSVSKAATWMRLTQGALSHHIKALEDFYGVSLFVRKSSPVMFTPAGRRLLEAADQVVPILNQTTRDLLRMTSGVSGTLRIAIECHTCFDWLMPAVDAFRARWPEVEIDLVSGYHADPIGLLHQGRADLALVSCADKDEQGVDFHGLFRYRLVGLVANDHALSQKAHLEAEDFRDETLVTYPVEDDALDVVRLLLRPAGIKPVRRTTELTVAILMLVATGRGIAVLPRWAVQSYLQRQYVTAKPITREGLTSEIWAATLPSESSKPYLTEFISLLKETTAAGIPEVELID
ncbi:MULTISPECIES: LysR family transcriptional regulator [Pseudomonas]|uniref:LysR family transcriptional regulator n=1 Tax=Pseudomonas TaxID=286 RepID=UPI0004D64C2B|nr:MULTISPECIES: LysR family transcriptional regulator [Pseudomonas]MDF3866213.1 LysR substrate-binding domain-containing protein [Pseudomonas denitrificans (nom. rej.)]KES20104.1 LysR family transcriptional regulator [Pseudomonas sp. AAC]MDU4255671.1 LysR substrate-binding domain-containing protein [Pseudomonas sp.]NMZ77446.1 LysR family transcriptional regulator [Pseudomonas nitroreducens]NNN26146.1 LysR family transcriptional regulator [Pseudomonas nitroreducens]